MPPVCAGPPALLNRQSIRAEFFDRQRNQRLHLRFDRDIGLAEDAGRPKLFRQRFALRGTAPGDDDFGAFGNEYLRGVQPDAAGRAGYHRDFAVQPSHLTYPF